MENKNFEQFNLLYLRTYAKQIGVKSPSSYSKSVLIEKIKNIEAGIDTPFFTKKGRPSLKFEQIATNKKGITKNQEKQLKKATEKFIRQIKGILLNN